MDHQLYTMTGPNQSGERRFFFMTWWDVEDELEAIGKAGGKFLALTSSDGGRELPQLPLMKIHPYEENGGDMNGGQHDPQTVLQSIEDDEANAEHHPNEGHSIKEEWKDCITIDQQTYGETQEEVNEEIDVEIKRETSEECIMNGGSTSMKYESDEEPQLHEVLLIHQEALQSISESITRVRLITKRLVSNATFSVRKRLHADASLWQVQPISRDPDQ